MTTAATAQATGTGIDVSRRMAAGALGGLVGGIVFGLMMQMLDMIGMVAMLVGSESLAVGWLVHLGISVLLGAGFGLVSVKGLDAFGPGVAMGVGYGIVWWVLGALVAMPARLGMPTFTINTMAWQSLMGHVVFGAILGAVAVAVVRAQRR
jgi:hypothetical protein